LLEASLEDPGYISRTDMVMYRCNYTFLDKNICLYLCTFKGLRGQE